ncbi:uncharacterized protein LOC143460769 isoform X1 [Clavelina lepadiformis]|uniref:uncharacterized protein LOC143460769 isoform X1 n=2 Tax=Clavelina lepadiformis TaxID=159417 RepID=UPI004041E684
MRLNRINVLDVMLRVLMITAFNCFTTISQETGADVLNDNFILVAAQGRILKLPLYKESSPISYISLPSNTNAYAVAVDIVSTSLYWSDYVNLEVWKADIDGENPRKLLTGKQVTEIEIDPTTGNIFILGKTSKSRSHIWVMNQNGLYLKTVTKRKTSVLSSLQLDLIQKYIYVIDKTDNTTFELWRMRFDGSEERNLSSNILSSAVDFAATNRLFLEKKGQSLTKCAGANYILQQPLSKKNISTNNSGKFICTPSNATGDFRFKAFNGSVYWLNDFQVATFESDNTFRPFHHSLAVLSGVVTSLSFFSISHYQRFVGGSARNPCRLTNCAQLCIPTSEITYDCDCQNGFHGRRCETTSHLITNSPPSAGPTCPRNMRIPAQTCEGASVNWTVPQWIDDRTNASNLILTSPNFTSPVFLNISSYTLNYTATDSEGKTGICTFTISVEENIGCGSRPLLPTNFDFTQSSTQCSNTHRWYTINCPPLFEVKFGNLTNKTFTNTCTKQGLWKYVNLYGLECIPDDNPQNLTDNLLIVVSNARILKIPLSVGGSSASTTIQHLPSNSSAFSAAVNMATSALYWSDLANSTFWKTFLGETKNTPLIYGLSIRQIEVDDLTGNVYVTANLRERDRIYAVNKDGLYWKTLFKVNQGEIILKIELDLRQKFLYYVTVNNNGSKLGRMRFDGSQSQLFGTAITFTIDQSGDKLLVFPSDTELQVWRLSTFNETGSLISQSSFPVIITSSTRMQAFNNALYFYDGFLKVSSTNGSTIRTFDNIPLLGNVTSIKPYSYYHNRQFLVNLTNPCKNTRPSCSHLCLATSSTTRDCDCGDGYHEKDGNCTKRRPDDIAPTAGRTCQPDFSVEIPTCQNTTSVTWTSPVWNDDHTNPADLVVVSPNITSPAIFKVGVHKLMYTATDSAGNTGRCNILVTVSTKGCGAQPQTPFASNIIQAQSNCFQNELRYAITCPKNRLVTFGNVSGQSLINRCTESGWTYSNLFGIECTAESIAIMNDTQYEVFDDFLLVVGGEKIFKIPLLASNASHFSILPTPSNASVRAAAPNTANGFIYWSDFANSQVFKANVDGLNSSKILDGIKVKDIQVDPQTGYLYLLATNHAAKDVIYVVNSEGLFLKTIYKTRNQSSILKIDLDIRQKLVVFLEQDQSGRKTLVYIAFDGSGEKKTRKSFGLFTISTVSSLYSIVGNGSIFGYTLTNLSAPADFTLNYEGQLNVGTISQFTADRDRAFFLYDGSLKRVSNLVLSNFGPNSQILGHITSMSVFSTSYYRETLGGLRNPCQANSCAQLCLATSSFFWDCDCQNGFTRRQNECEKRANRPPSYGHTCPADIKLKITSCPLMANASWKPPIWTDDRTDAETLNITTPNITSPATLALGKHVITYSATDEDGRTTQCSFTINIVLSVCGSRPLLPGGAGLTQTALSCSTGNIVYSISCLSNQFVQFGSITNRTFVNYCGSSGIWKHTNLFGITCVSDRITTATLTTPQRTRRVSTDHNVFFSTAVSSSAPTIQPFVGSTISSSSFPSSVASMETSKPDFTTAYDTSPVATRYVVTSSQHSTAAATGMTSTAATAQARIDVRPKSTVGLSTGAIVGIAVSAAVVVAVASAAVIITFRKMRSASSYEVFSPRTSHSDGYNMDRL